MILPKSNKENNPKGRLKMSTNHLINENEIIAASKKNTKHFKPIYENYYNPILNYVNYKVNDLNEAADLTSNVFYKALLNIKKYRIRDIPFSAWLYKIAFNETMQYFRETKKIRTVVIDDELIEGIADEFETEHKFKLYNAVKEVFNELTHSEVEIIEQKYFQQKSNTEIAYILGIKEGNLKVKSHRIIQKIKKLIAERNEQL